MVHSSSTTPQSKIPYVQHSENELLGKQAHKRSHITGAKGWSQATCGPQMCFMGSTHSLFKNVNRLPTFNWRKFRKNRHFQFLLKAPTTLVLHSRGDSTLAGFQLPPSVRTRTPHLPQVLPGPRPYGAPGLGLLLREVGCGHSVNPPPESYR